MFVRKIKYSTALFMLKLNEIKKPIAEQLDLFEDKFKESMQSSVPLLDRITHYIVKRKGKQVRPMFVFFAAGTCGEINETTHRGAALVELLHTATLVHDDVVDNAYERRGFFSVNALWKNKIAVLVGDFLLAKGLSLSIRNNDFKLLKIVTEAVEQMSEGELLQMEKARRLDIDEAVYFEVIRKKTASLIASCCACGAASVTEDESSIERMHQFGEKIGIAFQIKDDIKEKKITLPLIYALKKVSKSQKRYYINLVKNHNDDNDKVKEVIDFVRNSGGLDYAKQKMLNYQREAFDILNTFPDSDYKTGLQQLVTFTTERKK